MGTRSCGVITHLIICSKSTWDPPIRREHALAGLAADDGLAVSFMERPQDVRALSDAGTAMAWVARLGGGTRPVGERPGLEVHARSALAPAHLGWGPQRIDSALLRRDLGRLSRGSATAVVATTPWQWPAVRRAPAGRRLFDCADDWAALIPERRAAFLRLYERIALEADAISVASEGLNSLFPGRDVAVVRNGVSSEMLYEQVRPVPDAPRALYAGTLSERFDVDLVRGVFARCRDWHLDLYGQCQYPKRGNRPDEELSAMLEAFPPRMVWHGPVSRSVLARAIDSSRVCLLPHRRSVTTHAPRGGSPVAGGASLPSWRGDAMKLYDYAARGRPAVSTRWEDNLLEVGPPHLYVADTLAEFCEALIGAGEEPAHYAADRRAWAERQAWERRWPQWRAVIRGTGPPSPERPEERRRPTTPSSDL
jgi:glycosyltransferase involved in cell wall biosynthesis